MKGHIIRIPWMFKVLLILISGAIVYDAAFIRNDWMRALIFLNIITNYRVIIAFFNDMVDEDMYLFDTIHNSNVGMRAHRRNCPTESQIEQFEDIEVTRPRVIRESPEIKNKLPPMKKIMDYNPDDQYDLDDVANEYMNKTIYSEFTFDYNSDQPKGRHIY